MREAPSPELTTRSKAGDIVAGKYLLEQVLGQGGMGTVWRARNLALDAPVAIKILSAAVDSPAVRQRLALEAKAAGRLTHPAIVKVFDVGETEQHEPFIVMELLSGSSLATLLLREERLSAARVVQLLLPIADALQLAHDKGLVHRDVKPDNVFIVDDDGATQPKLVDFGIVKVAAQDAVSKLTRVGDVIGSPDYMSPEQARGQAEITAASDVWALSVVVYEAICGCPPFAGRNYNALISRILEATPRTLYELGLADEELSAIVQRGLHKRPEDRFGSMRQLGQALAAWLVRQGFSEDACGTALESKWLSRSSPDNVVIAQNALGPAELGARFRPTVIKPGRRARHPAAKAAPGAGVRWVILALAIAAAAVGIYAFAWPTLAAPEVAREASAPPKTARTAPVRGSVRAPISDGAPIVDPEALPLEQPDAAAHGQTNTSARQLLYKPAGPKPTPGKKDLLNPY